MRRIAPLVCTATATALALALATPATAYLVDFEVARTHTATYNGTSRSVGFSCPPGKFAIGVGAGLPNGFATRWTELAINRMWIETPSIGRVEVGAVETDPEPLPWAMVGQAYCAGFTFTQPNAATAGPYLKDVTVVSNRSSSSSSTVKAVTAACVGRHAIGGGFYLLTGGGDAAPPDVTIRSAQRLDRGFAVTAQESDPNTAEWTVRAYAVCANITDALEEPTYVGNSISTPTFTSPATSEGKSASAGCPSGRHVIGGSAEVVGAAANIGRPPEVVLGASWPFGVAPSQTGWAVYAFEEDPTSKPWRIRVRAVCAPLAPPVTTARLHGSVH